MEKLHRNDLYKFMLSQPSGLDTTSSGAKPLVLEPWVLEAVPRFARFWAEPSAESALRLTPEDGEVDLPLVAGDILDKRVVFFETQNSREAGRCLLSWPRLVFVTKSQTQQVARCSCCWLV
jgi:hypothetical protein